MKTGDKVWTIQDGWTEIISIGNGDYPIRTNTNSYTMNGYYSLYDEVKSIYNNNPFQILNNLHGEIARNDGVLDAFKWCNEIEKCL